MAGSPCLKLIEFAGEPIHVEFRSNLRARRGKLDERGAEVHAASFLHRRLIILDQELLRDKRDCERILAHEIFHFVWWKAPAVRKKYGSLIRQEFVAGTPGEMGWSADWRKQALHPNDVRNNSRRFRDYVCESFCDSCACLLLEISRHHEITLPPSARKTRRHFFEANLAGRRLKI
jgi:hypothetical protein